MGQIYLIHMLFRRQQIMGQTPVIGDEKEPLRVNIQPAHRKQVFSQGFPDKPHHRRVFPVLGGGHHALGLIEHIILHSGVSHLAPVHFYQVRFRVHLPVRVLYRLCVYPDPSLLHHILYLGTGSVSHLSQKPVKTHRSVFPALISHRFISSHCVIFLPVCPPGYCHLQPG